MYWKAHSTLHVCMPRFFRSEAATSCLCRAAEPERARESSGLQQPYIQTSTRIDLLKLQDLTYHDHTLVYDNGPLGCWSYYMPFRILPQLVSGLSPDRSDGLEVVPLGASGLQSC